MGERENRIEQIKDHHSRAEKSILASQVLLRQELFEDAVSRAYYGAFHAAKSLVIGIGEDSRTHRGVQHLIYTHFVKTEIMEIDLHRKFSKLLSYRGDADYGVIPIFTENEVESGISTAKEMLRMSKSWLSKKYETEFD